MNELTYEDCKDLKDCGFPQYDAGDSFFDCSHQFPKTQDGLAAAMLHSPDCKTLVKFPQLEELIEECGRRDFKLRQTYSARENKTFYVIEIPGADDMERCDTPKEAVARLYIAINT